MVNNAQDKKAVKIIQIVAEKYMMIHPIDLGTIVYDRQLYNLVSEMIPLTRISQLSDLVANVYEIALKLITECASPAEAG